MNIKEFKERKNTHQTHLEDLVLLGESLKESSNGLDELVNRLKSIKWSEDLDIDEEQYGNWVLTAWHSPSSLDFPRGSVIIQIDNDKTGKCIHCGDIESQRELDWKVKKMLSKLGVDESLKESLLPRTGIGWFDNAYDKMSNDEKSKIEHIIHNVFYIKDDELPLVDEETLEEIFDRFADMNIRKTKNESKSYNGYKIKQDHRYGGFNIYDKNGELEDYGFKSEEEAMDAVDKIWERKSIKEDTVKTSDGKWTNKGKEGTHGKFNTKKAADAQRKAMFANGYHESMNRTNPIDSDYDDSHRPWPDVKKELIKKYEKKGYKNVAVIRGKTDTKGLRSYMVYGDDDDNKFSSVITEANKDL